MNQIQPKRNKTYHRRTATSKYAIGRMSALERTAFDETAEYQAQFRSEGKEVSCLALDCNKRFFSPDPKRIRFCSQHRPN